MLKEIYGFDDKNNEDILDWCDKFAEKSNEQIAEAFIVYK